MPLLPFGGSSIMPLPKKGIDSSLTKRKLGLSGAAAGCIRLDAKATAGRVSTSALNKDVVHAYFAPLLHLCARPAQHPIAAQVP